MKELDATSADRLTDPGLTAWNAGEDLDLRELDDASAVHVYRTETSRRGPVELLLLGAAVGLIVLVLLLGPLVIDIALAEVFGR